MKLQILDIPEDPQLLPQWLDRKLVSLDLSYLVAELEVVHGEPVDKQSLESVIAANLDDVLTRGLSSLSSKQISSLMTQPALLLELQERILMDGGGFWDELQDQDQELTAAVNESWCKIQTAMTNSMASPDVKPSLSDPWGNEADAGAGRRSAMQILTAACGILLVIGLLIFNRQPAGWDTPSQLTQGKSPAAKFEALASASQNYLDASIDSPTELEREIKRFVLDCSKVQKLRHADLAAIPHPEALNPDSGITNYENWLSVKCAAWSSKASEVLTAYQEEKIDLKTAAEDYRKILEKLQSALGNQAIALA